MMNHLLGLCEIRRVARSSNVLKLYSSAESVSKSTTSGLDRTTGDVTSIGDHHGEVNRARPVGRIVKTRRQIGPASPLLLSRPLLSPHLPSPPSSSLPLRSRPLKSSREVWGSAISSPSGVWGRAPAEIDFGAF